jgi:hypothetical protein
MYTKAIFTLPSAPDGEFILNNRYRFIDKKLETDVDTAKLIELILVPYYGCTVEWVDNKLETLVPSVDKPTLAKVETAKAK